VSTRGILEASGFFPTTLRQSYLIKIHIHIEVKLSEICDYLKEKNKLSVSLSHFSGSLIEKTRRYLLSYASFSLPSVDWTVVEELTKLRDCIVHCNGNILKSRDQQYIRNLVSTRSSDHLYLSLRKSSDGEWLILKEEYNQLLTKWVQDFFNNMRNDIVSTNGQLV
jgi:hypothetical protein